METLFMDMESAAKAAVAPLAVRMRPRTLDELVGQQQAVGPGTWLRHAIESDTLSSIILFGPAGTGKTSLARIIAEITRSEFVEVSAITGGVADLRKEIDAASKRLANNRRSTILFVDEIHRFSRSQQDALLHAVEDRTVTLIGATTENPFFEVNTALNSRSRIIEFGALSDADIRSLVLRALADPRGLDSTVDITEDALDAIVLMAGGDGRSSLTTLEMAAAIPRTDAAGLDAEELAELERGIDLTQVNRDREAPCHEQDKVTSRQASSGQGEESDKPMYPKPEERGCEQDEGNGRSGGSTGFITLKPDVRPVITSRSLAEASPRGVLPYDKKGDVHYDVISAFIKSMRGSDPDAAVYWLARMIDGGEDPKFIARRMFIFASEDVGNADPQALLVAEAAFRSAEVIGYPECRINLAQAAIYMALAPKSNSAVNAIDTAMKAVAHGPLRAVPDHLRDRHRPGSEKYGAYRYPHAFDEGWVKQQYLPDDLKAGDFFRPGERGWEAMRAEVLERRRREAEGGDLR